VAISTRDGIAAFLKSVGVPQDREISVAIADVNGAPAGVIYADGRPINVVSVVLEDGLIKEVYLVANPDKLRHVHQAA
jgi:hypothetical protein